MDDLSSGRRESVPDKAAFVKADFADSVALAEAVGGRTVSAVLHFAARVSVPESVSRPGDYWRDNVGKTVALAEFCAANNIPHFVFSSSAAVYGEGENETGEGALLREDAPLSPVNPYGATKAACEAMLRDFAAAEMLSAVSLRYFNVAGADPAGRAGDPKRGGGGLFKAAAECAVGARGELRICGTDFPTPDGSALRDYIHVCDIASANLRALEFLENKTRAGGRGAYDVFNCGSGRGASVREVAAAMSRASGSPIKTREASRRPGDPAAIVSDPAKAKNVLGFIPEHGDLNEMAKTALAWERKLA